MVKLNDLKLFLKIVDLINICNKERRLIKQSIICTLIINILLSINSVDTNSILTALIMSLLIIVINSFRVRR
jgi:hypothetical protein